MKKVKVYTATLVGEISEMYGGNYIASDKFLYVEDAIKYLEEAVLEAMRNNIACSDYDDCEIKNKNDVNNLKLKDAFKDVDFDVLSADIVNDGCKHHIYTENITGEDFSFYVSIDMEEKMAQVIFK